MDTKKLKEANSLEKSIRHFKLLDHKLNKEQYLFLYLDDQRIAILDTSIKNNSLLKSLKSYVSKNLEKYKKEFQEL